MIRGRVRKEGDFLLIHTPDIESGRMLNKIGLPESASASAAS